MSHLAPAPALVRRLAKTLLPAAGVTAGLAAGYAATALTPAAHAADTPGLTAKRRDALVETVERVKAAVVNIHSERTVRGPEAGDPFTPPTLQPQRVNGMGTGIALDPRGYVVTNYHVVEDVQALRVHLVDGTRLPARVVATDKESDLAVIKIDPPRPLPLVPLGTAADLLDAEQVIAIGNAFGYEHTVSIGNVAFKSRDVKSRDVTQNREVCYRNLIQTTAPINPGNSGGPLFNKKGELVGVNVAIRAGAQNIAFAIPVDAVIERAADMLSSRRRTGVRHGLTVRDRAERADEESLVKRWAEVERVEPGSPADAAGLKAGDVVEAVGGVTVGTSVDVERGLLDQPAGGRVPVAARRGGEAVTTALVTRPSAVPPPTAAVAPADAVWRKAGLRLAPVGRDATARVDPQLRGGMAVQDVAPDSAAARAGLRPGDLLIGLHIWEALSADNVLFVLSHKDLPTFQPVKAFYVRDGKVRETALPGVD